MAITVIPYRTVKGAESLERENRANRWSNTEGRGPEPTRKSSQHPKPRGARLSIDVSQNLTNMLTRLSIEVTLRLSIKVISAYITC